MKVKKFLVQIATRDGATRWLATEQQLMTALQTAAEDFCELNTWPEIPEITVIRDEERQLKRWTTSYYERPT